MATFTDRLESTLVVPEGKKFTWHVNPSTWPEMVEHRVRILAEEPTREETFTWTGAWLPGDHVDFDFHMPESDVGLYVYYRSPDGRLVEVGSSGEFILAKEEALVELPEPGDDVLRAVNFASATPSFTMTAGLYGVVGEDVFGGDIVESYTLTCERPDGTVLQETTVTVDRGRTTKVRLNECTQRFDS